MWDKIKRTFRDDVGATAVEYGIMVALIAVVVISAVIMLGDNLSDRFEETAECVASPRDDCEDGPGGGETEES